MKVYPDVPARRRATMVGDLATAGLLGLLAWMAVRVHDAVDRLAVLGSGVREGGLSVQAGFGSAAAKVNGVPLVGDSLAGALRGAGQGSGGRVAALGSQGEAGVHHLALILAAVVFAVPALLVLALVLPRRVRQIRQLTAAAGVLAGWDDPHRRRLLAMRAAFGLPYGTLVAYTRDPLGDLADDHYDALVRAALEDAGVRAPAQLATDAND